MRNRAVVGVVASLVVVGLIVAGLFAVGSPATARKLRADQERRNRISQLHFVLASHVRNEGSLPEGLDEVEEAALRQAGSGFDARKDPESGEFFEYRELSDRRYRICATFRLPSDDRRGESYGPYAVEVSHKPGRNCYERELTSEEIQSAPDYLGNPALPEREPPLKRVPAPSPVETPSQPSPTPTPQS